MDLWDNVSQPWGRVSALIKEWVEPSLFCPPEWLTPAWRRGKPRFHCVRIMVWGQRDSWLWRLSYVTVAFEHVSHQWGGRREERRREKRRGGEGRGYEHCPNVRNDLSLPEADSRVWDWRQRTNQINPSGGTTADQSEWIFWVFLWCFSVYTMSGPPYMRQAVGRTSMKKMDNAATRAPRVREQNIFIINIWQSYKNDVLIW